jgi:hypothetical protein
VKRILFALLFACAATAQQTGAVRGVVKDAVGGEPVARVEIQLTAGVTAAITDDRGRFDLPAIAPGDYELRVSTVGYRTIRKQFSLRAGEIQEFEISLSPDTFRKTESVVVDAGPFETVRQESPSQLSLTGTEAKNLSSVIADDPLRAVQAMPGVVSNDDFDSRFSIRGADYDRVGLYLDDVLMHQPFHQVENASGGGSLTIFNGDMLEAMELYPGTMPPRLSDRTAGALDVHTREGSRTGPAVRFSAGVAGAGVLAEGPLGAKHRGSWIAAVRKSYLQYIVSRGTTDPSVAFGFFDTQGRLTYDLGRSHNLSLNVIDGNSGLDRTGARARLGLNSIMNASFHFTLANLGWRFAPSQKFLATARAAFLRETFNDTNPTPSPLSSGHYGEWVGMTNATWVWSGRAPLEFGASARRLRDETSGVSYSTAQTFRIVDHDRGRGIIAGGFLQQSWSAAQGKVHLAAGGRWDWMSVDGIPVFSPYAALTFAPVAATRLQLGFGQYAQYPALNKLYSLFGNRRLLPERSTHFVAAVEQRFGDRTRLRVEAYERQDRDLLFQPFYDPRLILGRIFNPPANPLIYNSTKAYARGVEVLLQRRSANRLTGWISYALGYARARDGIALIAYPTDQDQRHTVNVYGSYRVSPSVNVSLKWLYGSGLPLPGFFRQSGATYLLAEERNALRLDAYQRTDARINKVWPRDRWKITLYGEVVNLTNRTNYRWDSFGSYNNRTGEIRLTLDKLFPILPAAGVVIER